MGRVHFHGVKPQLGGPFGSVAERGFDAGEAGFIQSQRRGLTSPKGMPEGATGRQPPLSGLKIRRLPRGGRGSLRPAWPSCRLSGMRETPRTERSTRSSACSASSDQMPRSKGEMRPSGDGRSFHDQQPPLRKSQMAVVNLMPVPGPAFSGLNIDTWAR